MNQGFALMVSQGIPPAEAAALVITEVGNNKLLHVHMDRCHDTPFLNFQTEKIVADRVVRGLGSDLCRPNIFRKTHSSQEVLAPSHPNWQGAMDLINQVVKELDVSEEPDPYEFDPSEW